MKDSSAERFKRIFENHILPKWKSRRIDEITKRDVLNIIDDAMKRGPHAGNSAVTVCSIFFNWCLGRDMIATSPMAGVKKPTAESSRERTLSDDEIKNFLEWLHQACVRVRADVRITFVDRRATERSRGNGL